MENKVDYIEINRQSWNNRLETHVQSTFYDIEGFLKGKTSLNPIELELLGNIEGKSVLHLQCHFGQDSISLSRMGAQVTGIDLSDKAIDYAKNLATIAGTETEFLCCNIYDLEQVLDKKFDIVFTSYGTITWLPDLEEWAQIISHFLKPDGRFVFAEFHPYVWMWDNDFTHLQYSYFNREAICETVHNTYTNREKNLEISYVSWNHPISEVIQSLLKKGISLVDFQEYDYSPYDIFPNMIEGPQRQYRMSKYHDKLPLVYSLVGIKIR